MAASELHMRERDAKAATAVRGRRRSWAWRLGALVVSLCAGGLLAEMTVVLVLGEQPKFPRRVVAAPWGLRYNEPGARYRHKSADMTTYFRINGEGMRSDRDFTYEKTPGVARIISLGDSFTIGFEVDVEQCFSSVLAADLLAAGMRVEVLNAGVSGFSTAEELLYLERELIKYAPDLVLVSFYGNDIDDNVRTDLFGLQGGQLVPRELTYVPAGRLGDFLNTNLVFNFLSEHSNAFALAKETLTDGVKRRATDNNLERVYGSAQPGAAADDDAGVQLTAAIFERMYGFLRGRRIPLVIHSIPSQRWTGKDGAYGLVDLFPLDRFEVRRPGVSFAPAKAFLEPNPDGRLLYWTRSHGHWTPFSHAMAGHGLADLILREQLLH